MRDVAIDPLRLQRIRARSLARRKERGAVMFIVAMTLAVIAAMGMYALNVASTEVKTAGFVRESTQLYYLSEFGVLAATQEVVGGKTGMYQSLMMSPTYVDTSCPSLYGVPAGSGLASACRVMSSVQMATTWNPAGFSPAPPTPELILPYSSNATESTRGSYGIPLAPDFFIELTDMYQKPPPSGYALNLNLKFIDFTVLSVAQTPTSVGSTLTEGLQFSRARIVAGPTN